MLSVGDCVGVVQILGDSLVLALSRGTMREGRQRYSPVMKETLRGPGKFRRCCCFARRKS